MTLSERVSTANILLMAHIKYLLGVKEKMKANGQNVEGISQQINDLLQVKNIYYTLERENRDNYSLANEWRRKAIELELELNEYKKLV